MSSSTDHGQQQLSRDASNGLGDFVETPLHSELNAWLRTVDPGGWKKLEACPSCESHDTIHFVEVRNAAYDSCGDCGLVFANPTPSNQVANELYNSPTY